MLVASADEDASAVAAAADPEPEDSGEVAEHVKQLIEDCKKLLIPDLDKVVGAWGLIDNDPVTGKGLLKASE